MRGIPRQRKWLASLLVSLSTAELQAQIDWKFPENKPDYTILYSGRFFGYFRSPDIQTTADQGCPQRLASQAANTYFDNVGERPDSQIRVSMGDNFAPELFARKIKDASTDEFLNRDLFTAKSDGKWVRNGRPSTSNNTDYPALHGMVPSDNVGCFLKAAKFEAVVPGKDDFYFGPERLSQIARFLASEAGGGIQMLGANITVSPKQRYEPKPLPQDQLPEKIRDVLKPAHLASDEEAPVNIELPSVVLPWVAQIRVAPTTPVPKGYLCRASDNDPKDFGPPSVGAAGKDCRQLVAPASDPFSFPLPQPVKQFDFFLTPNANYAFCVASKFYEPEVSCKVFTVRQPLFQVSQLKKDEASRQYPLAPSSCETVRADTCHLDSDSPKPYMIHEGPPSIAVFGIVDASFKMQIGALNSSWLNDVRGPLIHSPEFDTKIEIVDPAEALSQILELCKLDNKCRSASKVVLAQMPSERALAVIKQVTSKTKDVSIDAIITQPDHDYFTGDAMLSRLEPKKLSDAQPFVIVPDVHYNLPDTGTVRRQEVSLFLNRLIPQGWASYASNFRKEFPVPEVNDFSDVRKHMLDAFEDHLSPKGKKERFEIPALRAMQKHCESDLAVLQKRDIFTDYQNAVKRWPLSELSNDNFIEEILWKGDFVTCQAITGASLKKAYQSSSANADKNSALVFLGVEKDPDHDSLIVHGAPLDEKRLYSIALSDFFAFGDTTYPDLASPDLPPPSTIHSIRSLYPLAEITAGILYKSEPTSLASRDRFHDIHAKPPDISKGFNVEAQTLDWFKHWILPNNFEPAVSKAAPKSPNTLNDYKAEAEQRSLNFFNIEKLNAAYNLTTINGPQQLVSSRFGSITNVPQLQATELQSVSAWSRIHFGHEFSHYVDFFTLIDTRYGFSRQRSESAAPYNPYAVSIKENNIGLDVGFLSKRLAGKENPLKVLLAEHLSTQLRRPLLSYSTPYTSAPAILSSSNCNTSSIDVAPVNPPSSPKASVLCAAPRSYLQETRLGFRLENRESWLQLGGFAGHNFDSVKNYTFNSGSSTAVFCSVQTDVSISTCIKGLPVNQSSRLLVGLQDLPVYGAFLEFKVAVPLYAPKLLLNIEGYSEVFAKDHLDNTTDTRFYQDIIVSLPLKLFQNLSFSPQIEAFNFQNKVAPYHFLSLTSMFTVDYTFNWHSGAGAKAFGFPDPTGVTKPPVRPLH